MSMQAMRPLFDYLNWNCRPSADIHTGNLTTRKRSLINWSGLGMHLRNRFECA